MADRGVQLLREWLQRQPFSLRMLTLLLFMVEAVEEKFGAETRKGFENDLRDALRKLPRFWEETQKSSENDLGEVCVLPQSEMEKAFFQ